MTNIHGKQQTNSQYIIMYCELFLSGCKKRFMVGTIFFSGYIWTKNSNSENSTVEYLGKVRKQLFHRSNKIQNSNSLQNSGEKYHINGYNSRIRRWSI